MSKLSKKQKWAITILMLMSISIPIYLQYKKDNIGYQHNIKKEDVSLEYGNHYCVHSLFVKDFKENIKKYSLFTDDEEFIDKEQFQLTIKQPNLRPLLFNIEDMKNDNTINEAIKREFSKAEN